MGLSQRNYVKAMGKVASVDGFEHDRVHADDYVGCDERADGWIGASKTRVTLRGTFDEPQCKRLTQVAVRCPIHKTLANGVHIVDSLAFEPR